METRDTEGRVAIIGWSGRFPGAASIEAFWQNLTGGVESLETFDEQSVQKASPRAFYESQDFVPRGFELKDTELFDADFFGIGANEARAMDPQHRMFLECCWEAVEDAGYDVDRVTVPVGVYAGAGHSTSLLLMLPKLLVEGAPIEVFQTVLYGDKDWVAPIVSFKLGFTGPSMAIQSGCSSGLFAVHQACQSLLVGESGMALAGAVAVRENQRSGYRDGGAGLWSPDGRVRPFDARASGTVFSNAVGALLLKRLDDAIADGDHIHAVIAGSAVNNDGRGGSKSSFAAPSIEGQRRVIEDALAMADLQPGDIDFVEAHGTGTPVGDVVEIAALNQVFGSASEIRLGSVKGNIGHAECASGIAGLIKTALCVERATIPPTVNHVEPSGAIDWAGGPLRVVTAVEPWPAPRAIRRAGVSSFGAGGTNAHAIVEQAPVDDRPERQPRAEVLMISARSPSALRQMALNLARHLRTADVALGDVAYTLRVGRQRMPFRAAVAASSCGEAAARLEALEEAHMSAADGAPRAAFVFPGAGPQTPGMSRRLYELEPVFREELESCLGDLPTPVGDDLRRLLVGPSRDGDAERIAKPSVAMPALFAHCAALLRLLAAWGIRPDLVLGHSFGEYVAAYAAGMVSRRDALRVVRMRGELLETLPEGAMLGVRRGAGAVEALLRGFDGLSIAAVNAPDLCVVSGAKGQVDKLAQLFGEGEAFRVHISTAGHSPLVEAIADEFERLLTDIPWSKGNIPLVSNVTGQAISAVDAAYWARHLRAPVRFSDGLRAMMTEGCRVAVEVGPGTSMTSLIGANRAANSWSGRAIPTMKHAREELLDEVAFHRAIGELWSCGAPVDERRFADEDARRVSLPTYPFARKRWTLDLDFATVGGSVEQKPEAIPSGPGEVEDSIVREFARVLSLPGRSLADESRWDTSFYELGGDSLLAAQLLARLREVTGRPYQMRDFVARPTIRALRGAAPKEAASRWLTALSSPPDPRWRLVCFHHAGGQGDFFRPWRGVVPDGVELYSAQLPGRGSRIEEPVVDSLDAVVPHVCSELEALRERPTVLFGHSMGALVAFAAARRLEALGRGPVAVFLSAFRAPHVPSSRVRPLHALDDHDLLQELRGLGGTPEEVLADEEWREILLRAFRADMRLCEVFEIDRTPIGAPLYVLGGTEDPVVPRDALEQWSGYTRGRFVCQMFAGKHFYLEESLTRAKLVGTLAGAIDDLLTGAER